MPAWGVGGSRTLYGSDTVTLDLVDVEFPDGTAIVDHHVLRFHFVVAAIVVCDGEGVLMVWRHRFITGRWAWDVPAGKLRGGEDPRAAAVRAAVEETGWRPDNVRLLGAFHASPGISDQRFVVCVADGAERVGEADPNEVDRVEWLPRAEVLRLARSGEIDGPSLTAVLWALTA